MVDGKPGLPHTDLNRPGKRGFPDQLDICFQGKPEIGEALHLSVKTISTHKTRILEKLRLTSTAGLVRYAIDNGIGTGDGESGHLPF